MLRYNDDDDDDDDEFQEAGFEPSSSKNAEKDSSTGTSCFKNRLESASLRDTAGFIINDQLFCGFCGDLKEPSFQYAENIPSSSPGPKNEHQRPKCQSIGEIVSFKHSWFQNQHQGQRVRDNDDDDDDEEAGFEPSSSDGAEMDLATGTSCFKNRQERASLKDDDGSVSRNEPSSCAENNSSSSSPGSKMSTNSQSTEIKNELILKMSHPVLAKASEIMMMMTKKLALNLPVLTAENGLSYKHILFQKQTRKGKLKDKAALLWNAMHENALFNTGNEGGGDEEACSEPVSSNALLEKDTSSHTSGVKYREERASNALFNTGNEGGGDEEACSEPLSSNALLEKDTSSRTSGYKYREERASNALFNTGNEGGGDEEACSEPLSSNALLEKDKSSRTSGYKYREERASTLSKFEKNGMKTVDVIG
ncbi:hypothetical protein DPMN_003886 [Dreissena polymorpha]|uniref:Uncharacterized protein n=1 Tax=Dreissena polymorpha TaxID=45954 RepID=A0A9D4RT23_DREPO|nr:hypothetical protein DPMN_003886 [Dreissena polymorpha]